LKTLFKKLFNTYRINFLLLFLLSCSTYSSEELISPNISLHQEIINNNQIVYLKISNPDLVSFEIGFADKGNFNKRKPVEKILEENNATAGINLSFFGYDYNKFKEGDVRGYCIVNGELMKSRSIWDLWMDTLLIYTANKNIQFYKLEKTPGIKLEVNGTIISDDLSINISLWGNKKDYVLFFNEYGSSYISSEFNKLFILKGNSKLFINANNSFKVENITNNQQNFSFPLLCSVKDNILDNVKSGDLINIETDFSDVIKNSLFSVSVGSIILMGGKYLEIQKEFDINENKSFVGILKTGEILIGCTLMKHSDLAKTLIDLNVSDSVLLDGGGSSCLNVKGKNIFGGNRDVVTALLIEDKND